MSRHASPCLPSFAWATPCALALLAPLAGAQTIADYSRAQRSVLENTMAQAAAHSAGLGASAPAVAATASVAAAVAPPAVASRQPLPALAPAVQVSGVFFSSNGGVAEIVVNATPYLLGAGQGVPGTAWRVESIAVDRVVLGRQGSVVATADAEGPRKVFPLPSLR